MIGLAAENVSYRPAGAGEILHGISLHTAPGTILGVLGPNGAGKSCLLRLFYGAARATDGIVRIGDADISHLSAVARARLVAAVPQELPPDFCLTVRDVVETGRIPYLSPLTGSDAGGRAAVDDALERLALNALAARSFATLSGGEKKRTLIARALAQQTQALVLDEPTNHLDIRHKLELMSLVRRLNVTVMVSFHDFDLAAQFCDRLAVLDHGRLIGVGTPDETLTTQMIRDVFGVAARISRDERRGVIRVTAEALNDRDAATPTEP